MKKILSLLLSFLLVTQVVYGAIVYDTSGSATVSNGTNVTINVTASSTGSAGYAVATICGQGTGSATYNGNAMTLLNGDSGRGMYTFGYAIPAGGGAGTIVLGTGSFVFQSGVASLYTGATGRSMATSTWGGGTSSSYNGTTTATNSWYVVSGCTDTSSEVGITGLTRRNGVTHNVSSTISDTNATTTVGGKTISLTHLNTPGGSTAVELQTSSGATASVPVSLFNDF